MNLGSLILKPLLLDSLEGALLSSGEPELRSHCHTLVYVAADQTLALWDMVSFSEWVPDRAKVPF